jgi:isoleucyl-tRNA synthetase
MSKPAAGKPYPDVPAQPSFPEIEERVLARWRRERSFERSVGQRPAGEKGENEYVFYDGPPFANGLPHFGHLLTSYVKDVVPRYQTLRGRRVERRFGWDCHGLPAELEAEKELGISGRKAILDYGIERFNHYCRTSVLRYTEQWQETITRAGRWVDFENDYKTMDLSYMESVIWAFAELHRKGLLYEGTRVLPYSWAAQTPVSNFETRLDDSFRPRQDPAITVRFELLPERGEPAAELWAWTTTPWTLPANLALAVGPALDYAVFEKGGRRVILGAACAEKYAKELEGFARAGTIAGSALVGRRYRPLFPYFASQPNAFRVLGGAFVDVAEGTGVVHMAPGFGEDDLELGRAEGIGLVVPVDDEGRFTAEVGDWAGERVFDANPKIIRWLKERGALVRHETLVHSYPHCWRTDTPLIYRAMDSWYVKVSAFRERMVELNRRIRWIPEHIRDGLFGNWLENARDWSITRNRFWGTPIPVWKSDDPRFPRIDVYGSLDALERDFGVRPDDLHRPAIDRLVRPNPDDPSGRASMRRVPDVLDVWFDSGSMPYAQVHYPFENRDWFEQHFPADFIVEYVAQTRGWFYTLMVLATALFERPPFRTCICHGVILDEQGRKLSKRLRNYPEPEEVFAKLGSDALRWYLIASPVLRGGELRVEQDAKPIADVVRNVLLPIWNAWYFFALYANTDGMRAKPTAAGATLLDRYVLAKTRELVERLGERMDSYDLAGACQAVLDHLEALNNWYIRRSRPRFWRAERDADKQAAYDTLYTALLTLVRAASPLLPFLSEEIHAGLAEGASVHLADWPDAAALPADAELVRDMDRVREVASAALALRRARNVRVRQPLASLSVSGPGAERLRPYLELIRDEVNVKEVRLSEEIGASVRVRLQPNARVLGPRLGAEMKKVLAAAKAGAFERDGDGIRVAGQRLAPGEYTLAYEAGEGRASTALASGELIAALDFTLSAKLVQEGLARDLVRVVQQARRDAGLHVADRIRLALALPADYEDAARAFADYVAENTLASEVRLDGSPDGPGWFQLEAELGGAPARVALARAPA